MQASELLLPPLHSVEVQRDVDFQDILHVIHNCFKNFVFLLFFHHQYVVFHTVCHSVLLFVAFYFIRFVKAMVNLIECIVECGTTKGFHDMTFVFCKYIFFYFF